MTATELCKAAHYLERTLGDAQYDAAKILRTDAYNIERDAKAEQIERRALERMDVPVTVRAGQLAHALHWINDHAFLSDAPIPDAVLELQLQLANVHAELLEGIK